MNRHDFKTPIIGARAIAQTLAYFRLDDRLDATSK